MKNYYVYILASERNGTLYVGVTSNLLKRVKQHKNNEGGNFTKKYNVNKLVYYDVTTNIYEAIKREKQIKAWKRKWKLRVIEEKNPYWIDLYDELTGCQPSLA